MRKIEQIKAELKELPTLPFVTADMIEADTIRLTDELIHAAVDGIPLDRLEAICAVEKQGCKGCKEQGRWENEQAYGYNSPCIGCVRAARDNYEAALAQKGEIK